MKAASNQNSRPLVNQDVNGVFVVDQCSIPRMMDQLQLTIRAKADGYSSASELAAEFYNDSHIDGEQLARRCGYPTFEAFLDSKDAKKIVEIKIVDGRRHYCAPYDVRTHHIYNEQKKSMAAAAQRQQRDNRGEVRAGIIGRRDYGEQDRQSSVAGFAGHCNNNAMSNSFNYGYDDARLSTDGLPLERCTSAASVRDGGALIRNQPSPLVRPFDYDIIDGNHQQSQRQLITATPQNYLTMSRPSPFGNINNSFDNNTGLPDLRVRSDVKQQPQSARSFSMGLPDNPRQNNLHESPNMGTIPEGNQKISDAASTAGSIFDDEDEDIIETFPANQQLARNKVGVEAVKGVLGSSTANGTTANTSATNPLFLELKKRSEMESKQPASDGKLIVRSSVSSVDTANLSAPKKVATIIWDETEEDEFLNNNNDNNNSQKKQLEQPKSSSGGHCFDDFSDSNEEDNERGKNLLQTYPTERLQPLTAQHQQNKPLIADIFRLPSIEEDDIDEFGMPYSAYTAEAAPKTVTVPGEGQAEKKAQVASSGKAAAPTQWTRRCVGEFTDSEESDAETDKEDDNGKTSAAPTLAKPPAVVVPAPHATSTNLNELTAFINSERPGPRSNKNSYGSDDDNDTTVDEEEVKNRERKNQKFADEKVDDNAPSEAVSTAMGKTLSKLAGEKGVGGSLGSRLEQQHQQEVAAKSAPPPSLTGAASPLLLLQRPTAIKPNLSRTGALTRLVESIVVKPAGGGHSVTANVSGARASGSSDVFTPNDFSRQSESRGATESPYGMRRCESTASVYSILQSGRWRQELTEEDLKKMGTVVTSVVRYQFPRTILLDDLLAVMEQIDRRFANMEQLCNYVEFVEKYCAGVELLGRPGCHNLIWKEK